MAPVSPLHCIFRSETISTLENTGSCSEEEAVVTTVSFIGGLFLYFAHWQCEKPGLPPWSSQTQSNPSLRIDFVAYTLSSAAPPLLHESTQLWANSKCSAKRL
jgi:hypothetical protein